MYLYPGKLSIRLNTVIVDVIIDPKKKNHILMRPKAHSGAIGNCLCLDFEVMSKISVKNEKEKRSEK